MKKYFILAAAALTLAACSNDESNTANDNVIRLSSSVGVVTRAASDIYPSGGHFENGTAVKVQLTADDGSVTYSAIDYTDDGSGTLTGESTQYYPANGTAVSGYAYYPSDASTASNGFVLGNQDDDTDYKKYDLMHATLTSITQNSNAAARTLTFNHLLSKITVTLVKGTAETSELNAATVTLKDVIVKGTFTPASGTFTAAADEDANKGDIVIATNAGTTAHSAIVIPQTMTGKKLEVKIGTATKEYTFPTSSFATGTNNTYTITVDKTGIVVTSTIGVWGTGTSDSKSLTF